MNINPGDYILDTSFFWTLGKVTKVIPAGNLCNENLVEYKEFYLFKDKIYSNLYRLAKLKDVVLYHPIFITNFKNNLEIIEKVSNP